LSEDTRRMTIVDRDFWAGRRVLITGHTGFKGAWLSLWLHTLGARVTGLAPDLPTRPSLYELARVGEGMHREHDIDVRDAAAVREAVAEERPEVVLHLAAQPLVRRSYEEPVLTYAVNVMGTVNVLEAVREVGDEVRAVVVVTSDKCYENPANGSRPFVEGDPLGGHDPYSSSKACAELVAAAYRRSFFSAGDPGGNQAQSSPRIATARAGNVIGGGDWGADRLIPDIVRAVRAGEPVRVRNPDAVRPWQHVLNPLSGYLALAQSLWSSPEAASAWNFGPAAEDVRTVGWIVGRLEEHWGGTLRWETDAANGRPAPPEAGYLALDSTRAGQRLGWRSVWDLEEALQSVVQWHRALERGDDVRQTTVSQIERFGGVGS
jgi:CDP-glucose 4,6-dehydratase